MSTVNIRDVVDGFDRYRMPELESRVKHQGQFHQTCIKNLPAIAKALKINLQCLVRHFGWKLNTLSQLTQNGDVLLKGSFDEDILTKTLRNFINQYVLCVKCTLPELDYEIKKKGINDVCRACGHRTRHTLDDKVYKVMHQEVMNKKNKKIETTVLKTNESTDEFKINEPIDDFDLTINDGGDDGGEGDEGWSIDSSKEAKEMRKQSTIGDSKILNYLL